MINAPNFEALSQNVEKISFALSLRDMDLLLDLEMELLPMMHI